MFEDLISSTAGNGQALPIDRGRQLFVDDLLIDFTSLVRTHHRPSVSPDSPVMRPETEIERNNGVMPTTALFSDGVFFDPDDRLYKMWYMAGYDDALAYAQSVDGIEWTRPELAVQAGTNRVLPHVHGYRRNGCTVWLDHDTPNRSERFKAFLYYRRTNGNWPRGNPDPLPDKPEKGHIYTSYNGTDWTFRGETGPCGDNSGMFYNGLAGKWVWSIRSKTSNYGRSRSYVAHRDFIAGSKWTYDDIKLLGTADRFDRPDPDLQWRPELYKLDCVAYESIMIGLFGIYFGPPNEEAYVAGVPKTLDLFLGTSRDGFDWQRLNRQAFLRCSRTSGTWNRGYLHAAGGICLVIGETLRFYFTGFSGTSPAQGGGPYADATIGYATLRRDGFASMDGPGRAMPLVGIRQMVAKDVSHDPAEANLGLLITKPVVFSGSWMFVNAAIADGGRLRIAILDASGRPLDGFGFEDCEPLTANSTKQAVRWRDELSLAELAGRPLRFAFSLDAGSLYSFWVSTAPNGASKGFVAAGGPGFTGATDTTGS